MGFFAAQVEPRGENVGSAEGGFQLRGQRIASLDEDEINRKV